MEYFDLFKKIEYNNVELSDISNIIEITNINNLTGIMNPYTIGEEESVNDIAFNVYGDDEFYWLVYLANPTYIFGELLNTEQFATYIDENLL